MQKKDVHGTIRNLTKFILILKTKETSLQHGKWRKNGEPESIIRANSETKFNAGRRTGSSYGTEGIITYSYGDSIEDIKGEIIINFKNPYSGSNSVSVDYKNFTKEKVFPFLHSYNQTGHVLELEVDIKLDTSNE